MNSKNINLRNSYIDQAVKSVGRRCYCDSSNYDHNLKNKSTNTPQGRKNIHEVQHSTKGGFNEVKSRDNNLAYVKRVTDYIDVSNGNHGGNGLANFNQKSLCYRGTGSVVICKSRYLMWRAVYGII